MMSPAEMVGLSASVALVILGVALILTTFRIIVGPTLPDRVVGLDMLVAIAIGLIAAFSVKTGFALYIDIAVALGLVGFLATVALARFILACSPSAPVSRAKKAKMTGGKKTGTKSRKAAK